MEPREYYPKIQHAIEENNVEFLSDFFAQHPAKLDNDNIWGTWIVRAVLFGQLDVVKFFVEAGLELNYRDLDGGENSISHAARKGNFKAVKYLYEHGAKLFTDMSTSNPLLCAMHKQNTDLINYLLELGLDPTQNYSDPSEPIWSPLVMARLNGLMIAFETMVQWLAEGDEVKAERIRQETEKECQKHTVANDQE